MAGADVEIHFANPADPAACPEIERRAAGLFSPSDLPASLAAKTTPVATFALAQKAGRLIVARSSAGDVVGFLLMTMLGDEESAHLEELDVDPNSGRQGIGARLVRAACASAHARGDVAITLSTFRDVAWNAPFYSRMGFEVVPPEEWTDAIWELRAEEKQDGLDVARRVVMRRAVAIGDSAHLPR